MKKYTYSKTFFDETFTAVEFDSFDEAIKAVERGIYERQLSQINHSIPKQISVPLPVPEKEYNEVDESTRRGSVSPNLQSGPNPLPNPDNTA